MKVSVIGNGRWGAFLAWYLNRINHDVTLYGREGSKNTTMFVQQRSNGMLSLPQSVQLTTDIRQALQAPVVLVSIPSQNLRGFMVQLAQMGVHDKLFVLCMKGIEIGTGKRLSQVASEELDASNRVAVWLGPGHVQEFVQERPNCMVLDAENYDDKQLLVNEFSSELVRFYYGEDLIGNEIGAAAKNVVGIAAGMLDGFGLGSLKGALMSRGTREFARLILAMGGSELSAYGLCHLGDYEATVFSMHSNNRRFGESFVKGEAYDKLAEGYYTVDALMSLSKEYDVELPISAMVYEVLYNKMKPQEALNLLFARSLKQEFSE